MKCFQACRKRSEAYNYGKNTLTYEYLYGKKFKGNKTVKYKQFAKVILQGKNVCVVAT